MCQTSMQPFSHLMVSVKDNGMKLVFCKTAIHARESAEIHMAQGNIHIY